jgi:hypothetical protein
MTDFDRRAVLGGLLAALFASTAVADAHPEMTVHKDPNCGCCGAWVEHVRAAGFHVRVIETAAMDAVKKRLGVPDALASCHTAEIGRYVIEGHVPATEIARLLEERPVARGLAVPGMPTNSPGMEVRGAASDVYDVMQFAVDGSMRKFATYKGPSRM